METALAYDPSSLILIRMCSKTCGDGSCEVTWRTRQQCHAAAPCTRQGQLCATAFVPHVLDVDWLSSAVVYCVTAEPRSHNAQTEASHALRQHDCSRPQWLAHIQLAQRLLGRQLCFLVFAGSGGALLAGLCSTSAQQLRLLKVINGVASK